MAENEDRGGATCGNPLRLERKGWRWCFVPGCKNTSVSAPNKIFLQVPKDLKTRRLWARLARREDASTLNSRNVWFCCEDHFNVSWRLFCSIEPSHEIFQVVNMAGPYSDCQQIFEA